VRVAFFPSDFDGPGCYRCLFPGRQLREQFGWDVKIPEAERIDRLDSGEARYVYDFESFREIGADLWVLQLVKQLDGLEMLRGFQAGGIPVVSEVDDWYLGTPSYNPGFAGLQPRKPLRNRRGEIVGFEHNPVNRNVLHQVFAESDALTCATPVLAEGYARLNRNVHVLRNYLDWEMWEDVELQYDVPRPRVRVGWMGRALYRGGDLNVLKGLIGPWLERNPHVDFVAAGDETVHDLLGVPAGQRVTYPGVKFHSMRLPEITAVMDVGLVPLESNRFNDAKSHLKGMEYAACGIPCIASPADSYAQYWLAGGDDGRVGMLARRPKDWVRALDLLVNDHEVRREMGRAARLKAAEHTVQKNAWRWRDVYTSVASLPVAA
jgi:glycosyltransferase involved in cell wall biosynthesis